jgi:hypothetical protein
LMSASRHQDHTASPSASHTLVRRSEAAIASRATFRDDRDTPLDRGAGRDETYP